MPSQDSNELNIARDIIEQTGVNLFLTGKAGTGKTTFLRQLSQTTSKRHVILAPTGVAAINAGGSTIHSFFQLSFAPFVPGNVSKEDKKFIRFSREKTRLIRTIDLVVIDEISMVRPDVLDAVDDVLRKFRNPLKPFGGVQLLMIGDLRQLAPVAVDSEWNLLKDHYASPYFFESKALREAGFITLELTKVFRQSDRRFVDILNAIRENKADESMLAALNRRADPRLFPADDTGYIRLTTHNARANAINEERLSRLSGKEFVYRADITGVFPESAFPAESCLVLKEGAQVMFVKNDTVCHSYYNGLIGDVIALDKDSVTVRPRRQEGYDKDIADVKVGKETWQNTRYALDANGAVTEVVEGEFSQVPLRPAWAITIHKSQGLTFDKAIVDACRSFAPGQTYVALSRCRSLDGLLLESSLPSSAIFVDRAVSDFIGSRSAADRSGEAVERYKKGYYADLLKELFDFRMICNAFEIFMRDTFSLLGKDYPNYTAGVDDAYRRFNQEVLEVQGKLFTFLNANVPGIEYPEVKRKLDIKVRGGCSYFADKIFKVKQLCDDMPSEIDNTANKKRITKSREALSEQILVRLKLLEAFEHQEFGTLTYLKEKAKALLEVETAPASTKKAKNRGTGISRGTREENAIPDESHSPLPPSDISDPQLYETLRQWRLRKAGGRPVYTVLSNRCLLELTDRRPANRDELASVSGIGKRKIEMYGDEILDIIAAYLAD